MNIIGFEQISHQLIHLFKENKLHHANLIIGNQGIGKASFAKAFCLKILNSTQNFHPNLKIITKIDNKTEITAEPIRELKNFAFKTTMDGQAKFIIIDSACILNEYASNSLLKILEEPLNNTYFFLIGHQLNQISATIRSRCSLIRCNQFSDQQFNQILAQNQIELTVNDLKFLKTICDNSIASAVDYYQDLIDLYSALLNSFKNQIIDPLIFEKLEDKNFPFFVFEKVILFFLYRVIKNYHQLIDQYFFNEQEIFNNFKNKFHAEKLINDTEEIIRKLNLIKAIYLDKKLFIINFFNNFSQ